MAFSELGCEVDVLCPRQHPAALVKGVRRTFGYSPLWRFASLRRALVASNPELIIPCDEDSAALLCHSHDWRYSGEARTQWLCQLIRRSLGTPSACSLAAHRWELMSLARIEGIRTPDTAPVARADDLRQWILQHGYPAVVKADHSWGGLGVWIVRSPEDIDRVCTRIEHGPGLLKSALRAALDRNLIPWLRDIGTPPHSYIAQQFITGRPANRAVACHEGVVLAGISVEAVHTLHPTGPATVVRTIQNQEMSNVAARLVRRLGLTGLWGFDFVLEAASGRSYLIEMNPRATPVCHLPLGSGRDLPAALLSRLRPETMTPARPRLSGDLIAMFPGEFQRDPASPYLRGAYHDVPWEQVAFLRDCLDQPWEQRGLLARWKKRIHPTFSRILTPRRPLPTQGPLGSPP